MMKLLKGIPYVRQRTVMSRFAYVGSRTFVISSVVAMLGMTSCASSTATSPTPGLVTIQTAVTCPAPPSHNAVASPVRHFAAPPRLTLGHSVGYCAYIGTTAGIISVRLRPEYAPHAVSDFIYLAQHG